jgi:hypothetical protein
MPPGFGDFRSIDSVVLDIPHFQDFQTPFFLVYDSIALNLPIPQGPP